MDWSIVIAESGPSLHGYSYPEQVLQDAIPLYQGRPVRAHPHRIVKGKVQYQHLSESQAHMAPYLVREMIGTIESPWWHEGAILARLHLFPSCELSDDALHCYGLSHQVSATVLRDADKRPIAVEKINFVESLDLVEHPAARGRILGPWLNQADAQAWHRAERAMCRFERATEACGEIDQHQAMLRRHEQRLEAVVSRYEARMEALCSRSW